MNRLNAAFLLASVLFVSACVNMRSYEDHVYRTHEERVEGDIVVTGADKDGVKSTVLRNIHDVRMCFEKSLSRHPDLEGSARLAWNIDSTGKPTEVHVERPLEAKLDECLVEEVKTWTFPEPTDKKEAKVLYPFIFTRNE